MRLASNQSAASPLTVIAVVVLLAVVVTAAVLFLAVDTELEVLEVEIAESGGERFLEVARVEGSFAWSDVDIRLVNQAGTDRAGNYLRLPAGEVGVGARIVIEPRPPAGDYLLDVRLDGQVLTQRVVTL